MVLVGVRKLSRVSKVLPMSTSSGASRLPHMCVQVQKVRKGIQCAAFLAPALALLSLTMPNISSATASALFVAALGMQSLGQAGFVANMSDIAPSHSGKLFGLCNTFGSAAGIIGVTLTGWLYEATGSFNTLFRLTAALYVLGGACFLAWAKCDPIFGSPEGFPT
jgi:MFS transporter, ACS family, solute carrier family 17 (sodium-dependent inorganic phosphate cotransporter), member 9